MTGKGSQSDSYWAARSRYTNRRHMANIRTACPPDSFSSLVTPDHSMSYPLGRHSLAIDSTVAMTSPELTPLAPSPVISADGNMLYLVIWLGP